jgi:peptidylprolyl isomerase
MTHCYGTLGVGAKTGPTPAAAPSSTWSSARRRGSSTATSSSRAGAARHRAARLAAARHGALGFYEKPEQRTSINRCRIARRCSGAERTHSKCLRTDTPLFTQYVESRRNRREPGTCTAGHIDVCKCPIPSDPRSDQ